MKKQIAMAVRIVIDEECYVLNSNFYTASTRSGYPEACGPLLQNLYYAGVPVILNCPKDAVELSPSKKQLIFSEKTQTTIDALASDFVMTFQHHAQKVINSQTSRFDALSKASVLLESSVLGLSKFYWRGEPLPLKPVKSGTRFVGQNFIHEGRMRTYSIQMNGQSIHEEINFYRTTPSTFFDRLGSDERPVLLVVAADELEYEDAIRAIRNHAVQYKTLRVAANKPLDIILAFASEPLLKWFNGSQITLQQFQDACRDSSHA